MKEPFGRNSWGEGIRFAGTVLELEVEWVLIDVSLFMRLNQPSCLGKKPLHSSHRNQKCGLLTTQTNPMLQIVRQTGPERFTPNFLQSPHVKLS